MKRVFFMMFLLIQLLFISTGCNAADNVVESTDFDIDYIECTYSAELAYRYASTQLHAESVEAVLDCEPLLTESKFYFFLVPNYVTTSWGEGLVYSFAVGRQPFNLLDNSPREDPIIIKINEGLREAITEWVIYNELVPVDRVAEWHSPEFPTPTLVTYNYRFISVITNVTVGSPRRFIHYTHAVTINSQTGERVFLDDLINIDDAFLEHLQIGNFIRSRDVMVDSDTATRLANERISAMSKEELRIFLWEASSPQFRATQEREDGLTPTGMSLGSNTFFVQPGMLTILEPTNVVPSQYIIYVEDILDFLKVPAW